MAAKNQNIPRYQYSQVGDELRTVIKIEERHEKVWDSVRGNFSRPNPYYLQVTDEKSGSYSARQINGGEDRWTYDGDLLTSVDYADLIFLSDLQAKATQQAIERFYGNLGGDLNLAVSIAETTRAEVIKSAKVVTNAINERRYDRANFKNNVWRRGTRLGSAMHLINSFAIMPTMGDIFNTISHVQSSLRKNFGVRSTSTATDSISGRPVGPYLFPFNSHHELISRSEGSARCKIQAYFKVNDLAWFTGLTSLDPAVIAWNLLPFSWLADYFYNVGSYLAQLETAARYQSAFRSGFMTTSRKLTKTQSGLLRGAHGPFRLEGYASEASVSYRISNRQILTSMPRVQAPRFECDLGSGQLLNVAALLGVFINSKPANTGKYGKR